MATREGSLAYSLLTKIDPGKVAMDEIKEAFCRDVDNLDLKALVCSLSFIIGDCGYRKVRRLRTRGRVSFVTQSHLLHVL